MSNASEATGDSDIFQKLDNYDWENDKQFQGGLVAILGPNPAPSQIQDLTIRAQCFYLSRKEKNTINFDSYKVYLTTKYPDRFSQSSMATSTSNMNMPSTKSSAPALQKDTSSSSSQGPNSPDAPKPVSNSHPTHELELPPAQEQSAPYPPTFAEIIELITSGAPIPGIRDIPSITVPHLASKPTQPRRRKPWEKDIPEEIILNGPGEGTFGDRRDQYIVQELPEEDMPTTTTP